VTAVRYLDPLAGATTVFDEETQSLTRLLQWVIQSLAIYELSVDEAVGVFDDFQATAFPDNHPKCSFAEAEKAMRQAMSKTAKFEELSTKMDHLRNRGTERDGVGALRMECFGFQANMPPQLLNASCVMESRDSTECPTSDIHQHRLLDIELWYGV
jgi:hypothetical protein